MLSHFGALRRQSRRLECSELRLAPAFQAHTQTPGTAQSPAPRPRCAWSLHLALSSPPRPTGQPASTPCPAGLPRASASLPVVSPGAPACGSAGGAACRASAAPSCTPCAPHPRRPRPLPPPSGPFQAARWQPAARGPAVSCHAACALAACAGAAELWR